MAQGTTRDFEKIEGNARPFSVIFDRKRGNIERFHEKNSKKILKNFPSEPTLRNLGYFIVLDDALLQNFIDIGLEDRFPIVDVMRRTHGWIVFSPKIIKHLMERSTAPIERVRIGNARITSESIASFTMFTELKHLTVNVRFREDAQEIREALLALFSKLPTLETIVINGREIKRPE